jgi:hypothetical protein
MKMVLAILLGAALVAGCGDTEKSLKSASSEPIAAASDTESSSAPTTEAPNPKGKTTGSCDMLLNDDYNSSTVGWLVADVRVTNTGNVGLKVNTKAVWKQAGSAPIVKIKPVRVPVGRAKTAHFKVPIDQNTVSAYQSAPGYISGNGNPCSTTATIMGTYGG